MNEELNERNQKLFETYQEAVIRLKDLRTKNVAMKQHFEETSQKNPFTSDKLSSDEEMA